MPPCTEPFLFTYYAFSRTVPLSVFRSVGKTPEDLASFRCLAKQISQMRPPYEPEEYDPDPTADNTPSAHFSKEIDERQMRMVKQLERTLNARALWTASASLALETFDALGNERTYDVETILERCSYTFNLYSETYPLYYSEIEGKNVLLHKQAFERLADHPAFAGEERMFAPFNRLFKALTIVGQPEDWRIVQICRSYYLHNQ